MIHTKLTFEASGEALTVADSGLAAAKAREASVDTRQAEASAALQAALDEQALLSGRIAKGGAVKASEAGAAASKIADAREHLALTAGAKEIAAADVAKADETFRHARFSHACHSIRQARRDRAAALRRLAASGKDFGEAVAQASEAGENLLRMQIEAQAAAKFPHQIPINHYDTSATGTRWLSRALPGWIISSVRESMIEHYSYEDEADREEAEANK